MTEIKYPLLAPFGQNLTLRLYVQQGDLLLWVRWSSPFSMSDKLNIVDMWEARDGDELIITNRFEDLPPWFELHPTEAVRRVSLELKKKIQAGYEPGEIMDLPNLWRVLAGDFLVHIGEPDSVNPQGKQLLSILVFEENALVVGESEERGVPDPTFGDLSKDKLDDNEVMWCRRALSVIRHKIGRQDSMADEWRLG